MASATCNIEDMDVGELPPVDVFKVREEGKSYYFAFGGCRRFQAYDRIGSEGNKETLSEMQNTSCYKANIKVIFRCFG